MIYVTHNSGINISKHSLRIVQHILAILTVAKSETLQKYWDSELLLYKLCKAE